MFLLSIILCNSSTSAVFVDVGDAVKEGVLGEAGGGGKVGKRSGVVDAVVFSTPNSSDFCSLRFFALTYLSSPRVLTSCPRNIEGAQSVLVVSNNFDGFPLTKCFPHTFREEFFSESWAVVKFFLLIAANQRFLLSLVKCSSS